MDVAVFNEHAQAGRDAAETHLADLEALYSRMLARCARDAAREFRGAVTAAGWQPPPEGNVLSPQMIGRIVTAALAGRVYRRIVRAAVGEPLQRLGISWTVKHPLVAALLEAAGQRTGEALGEAVQPILRATIAQAYEEGLSVRDTADRIREAIEGASEAQAHMLARTDLNGLANGGSVAAAKLAGVGYKQWLCLAPESRVVALPLRVARRAADPWMLVLRATGTTGRFGDPSVFHRDLTVTPDHPLLTGRGWIPAKLVQPQDRVFGCPALDPRGGVVKPDVEDAPPTIAEVFAAASERSTSERMVSTVVNLDGERVQREVDVVAVDGELRERIAAQVNEQGAEFLFATSDVSLGAALANGVVLSGTYGRTLTSPRFRSAPLSGVSAVTVERPARPSGFGLTAQGDATQDEHTPDGLRGSADAQPELPEGFAGLVTPLEVVSIEVVPGRGYVYDLETESGWLLANGMIVHNSAEDERVRPDHEAADGQTVPVDQPFTVGGEFLDFPGDPAASDAQVCNCRCSVVYLDAAEAVAAAALQSGGTMSIVSDKFVKIRPAVAAVAPPVVRWTSDIAFEGTATDDGRFILPGALDWRELPLTLMALTETGPGGHEGAFVAGRIDAMKRDRRRDMDGDPLEQGVTAIRATGVFDVEGENGAEVARLVDDETVRGVSIDMAIHETALRDPATGDVLGDGDEIDLERLFSGDLQMAVVRGTIMAATVCPTPAFANARIAVTASGERVLRITVPFRIDVEAVTAAAAGLAPMKPPREWFETPEADGPRALTVSPEGRVSGHIAVWDSCHTGKPGVCFQPPSSPSGYAYFNLGEVECADGSRVACGQITMDTGHPSLSESGRSAKRHYDHTGVCAADVRATDGRFGIWVAGAVRPGVTEEQARALMGAKPSGDWRSMTPGGPLELIGILAVNVPGFPVPRPEVKLVASAEHPEGETVALVAAGFEAEADAFERRLRVLGARAEGGIDGLAELAGV